MAKQPGSNPDACPVDPTTRSAWLRMQNQTQSQPFQSESPYPYSTRLQRLPFFEENLTQHELSLLHRVKASSTPLNSQDLSAYIHDASPRPRYHCMLTTSPRQSPYPSLFNRLFWASPDSFWFYGRDLCKSSSPEATALVGSIVQRRQKPHERRVGGLSQDREISSIPRAAGITAITAMPSNHETETNPSASGHWIYPSERQFFDAMARKGHSPQSADMKTIVPIHNAVNERAWREIQAWEKPWISDPEGERSKLVSFMGKGSGEGEGNRNMSPRARWRVAMGYLPPFDRHDWVVERGEEGRRVEYVIDFYSGKEGDGDGMRSGEGKKLSFYLDVRPKLNTWEGWKMRIARATGCV